MSEKVVEAIMCPHHFLRAIESCSEASFMRCDPFGQGKPLGNCPIIISNAAEALFFSTHRLKDDLNQSRTGIAPPGLKRTGCVVAIGLV